MLMPLRATGNVDKDGMDLTHILARAASSTGEVKYITFPASVHWEGRVVLCNRSHGIFRARVQLYTPASGHARISWLLLPAADIE
jgi:hypothetical protein